MKKAELAFLERVFAAEIDAALSGEPLRALVHSKSKVAKSLEAGGYIRAESIVLGGRFPVTVTGYVLTLLGNMTYCFSCGDDDSESSLPVTSSSSSENT